MKLSLKVIMSTTLVRSDEMRSGIATQTEGVTEFHDMDCPLSQTSICQKLQILSFGLETCNYIFTCTL